MPLTQPLKLPRLIPSVAIVDKDGKPSREFTRFWDDHCTLLEEAINGLVLAESQASSAMGVAEEVSNRLSALLGAIEAQGGSAQDVAVLLSGQLAGPSVQSFNDLLLLSPPQSVELPITEAMQKLIDVTTWDVSTSRHGYAPKGDGSTSKFLNANGAYSTPAAASGGALSLIATATGSGSSTITFDSIPGSFQHLLLLYSGRSSAGASVGVNARVRFNNDSGSNYDYVEPQLQNGTYQNNTQAAQTSILGSIIPWSGAPAGNLGSMAFTLFNYIDTNLFKAFRFDGASIGATSVGTTFLWRTAGGLWRSTSAVTRIDIILDAGNHDTGSFASLYGIS